MSLINRFYLLNSRISSLEITLFLRQLTVLLTAGISILNSLDILRGNKNNIILQSIINSIACDIAAGYELAQCLSKFPHYFDKLTCHLIQMGEQSGTLIIMLNCVIAYKEKILLIKNKLKQVLFYPCIIIIVSTLVTIAMLTLIVPRFAELFESMHSTLPAFTLGVINLSHFFCRYGWVFIFAFCSMIFLWCYYHSSPQFKSTFERFTLYTSLLGLGSIYMKSILARFCRSLAIMYSAGIPITTGLPTIAHATCSSIYTPLILQLCARIKRGQSLHQAMQASNRFPALMTQMVKIGEESGTLEQMLEKIAEIYENEVDRWLLIFSQLLEPLIIVILGALIGGLVVAMYLPIFKLGNVM
jgi:type IV pilus assembly protein PilC